MKLLNLLCLAAIAAKRVLSCSQSAASCEWRAAGDARYPPPNSPIWSRLKYVRTATVSPVRPALPPKDDGLFDPGADHRVLPSAVFDGAAQPKEEDEETVPAAAECPPGSDCPEQALSFDLSTGKRLFEIPPPMVVPLKQRRSAEFTELDHSEDPLFQQAEVPSEDLEKEIDRLHRTMSRRWTITLLVDALLFSMALGALLR